MGSPGDTPSLRARLLRIGFPSCPLTPSIGRYIGNGSRQIQLKRAMKRLPIMVSMISGAEAPGIGHALESVAGWTSEILMALNADVTDGTEAIAL